jgi:hypothetical protein
MKKLRVKTLSDYVGRDNARILEESGYRTRDDLMNAKAVDLLLLGSFPVFSLEMLIAKLYKEEHPRSKIDVDDLCEEPLDEVKVLGLTEYDDPTPKMKRMTLREICEIQSMDGEKIIVLLRILHNGTISKKRQDTYYEMLGENRAPFNESP